MHASSGSARWPRRCAPTRAASAPRPSATPSAGRSTPWASQYIRTAAIIQLLLGNIGRPGGGILALRGHASIQGSTDIPTLYDLLPGYLPMPHAQHAREAAAYLDAQPRRGGYWGEIDAYTVSLLKAWWGETRPRTTTTASAWLPRSTATTRPTARSRCWTGTVKGYFLIGENPAVGSANGGLHRRGLANLDWLVVRDLVEIETAAFWHDGPEIETGELRTEEIGTEVFFLPGRGAHREGRLVHQHPAPPAVAPQGGGAEGRRRSDLWFMLPPRPDHPREAARLARAARPRRARADLGVPDPRPDDEPSAEAVLAEINGYGADGPLTTYTELKADGSTSAAAGSTAASARAA